MNTVIIADLTVGATLVVALMVAWWSPMLLPWHVSTHNFFLRNSGMGDHKGRPYPLSISIAAA